MKQLQDRFNSSLGIKLGTAIGLMLLLALLTLGGVLLLVSNQRSDAHVLNLAGRQRMLTQRIAKNSVLLEEKYRTSVVGVMAEGAEAELIAARDLFEVSHFGLRDGSDDLDLPGTNEDTILAQMDYVYELWQPLSADVTILLEAGFGDERIRPALERIGPNANILLAETNAAVELFEADAETKSSRLLLFIGIGLVLTLLAAAYGFTILRSILQQADAISDALEFVEAGDLEARAKIVTQDELGRLAGAFNNLSDNTLKYVQSEDERDSIQAAILKLLDEVSTVADGDLTVEAEVDEGVTGAIADSFNFMIEQLREIIGNVKQTTLQVTASANEIQTTAEHLAQGSEVQAAQIVNTSAAIDEMSVSIQQVSENSALSATVGEQARANARKGATAVDNTIEGMERIREQVSEIASRITNLGESSQEIGNIVKLISDIAERTSILALNASIQAAIAGDAGRGFAVVAEEVELLAERSAEATQQVSVLVRNIQAETSEVVAAMEVTSREVVEGSVLAAEAGKALDEIETVSDRLAELIQSISLAAQQQARGSETIARAMSDIAEVTQQTASGTKQATVSIGSLAQLTEALYGSMSQFQLAPGPNNMNGQLIPGD